MKRFQVFIYLVKIFRNKKYRNLNKGETNINAYGTISADEIEKIIVPVGKKEYYQNLIDDEVIDCSNIGSIVEEQ